jgi:hypothetical protein
MPTLHKNITASADIHNPKWFPDANNGDVAWRNEKGELESTDELVLPAALNFVDASVAPPTTNDGDIYVLSSGGSVNAGWGAVSLDDWVRYDLANTTWNSITPQKSSLCYDKTTDSLQFFDGTNWAAVATGIQNLDTATKSALTPSTGDFVYDTDLDSLQRYDGAAWVDLAKGYGVIEVITDSDSGVPTYFTDLQTALETCKTSGSNNVVKLHSDISLSAQIDINSAGTGTGNGYQFNSLLIDGNGFEISFDDAGSTSTFDINLNHTCNISIVNTTIKRTSGTGTHYAFDIDGDGFQTISMANNYFYSDNGGAAFIRDITGKMFDLGGTRFESDGSINTLTFRSYSMYYRNFSTVSNGSGAALFNWSDGDITNFTTENTSTGKAYDSNANAKASFFTAKSNSGVAVDANISSCVVTNFKAESTSGNAFLGFNATNFYLKTGNAVCLSAGAYANLKNGYVENNSTSSTMDTNTIEYCHNVTFVNYGSGYAADLNNTVSFNNKITNCTFISEGGIGAFLDTVGVEVYNCTFISRYNNAAGHACELDVSGCRLLGCVFIVENASANGLYSNTALNADVANCSFDNATTPINANITVNASTDLGNGNRQY